jgi:5-formyltetrahydrofolate cyclo-ligase
VASSYGEDASKQALRNGYLSLSSSMSPAQRRRVDAEVRDHLKACSAWRETSLVLSYVPFRDEVATRGIIEDAWDAGKTVALPRCVGGPRSLAFYTVRSLEALRLGSRGVLEPVAGDGVAPVNGDELVGSVCLVPGLVFDSKGYRVGYGAGFYDNFLSFYPGTKIGLARTMQLSGNPLPTAAPSAPSAPTSA